MIGALVEAFFHWVGKKRKLIKVSKEIQENIETETEVEIYIEKKIKQLSFK